MKLHLGCGKNILKGWVNIDLHHTEDVIGIDLSKDGLSHFKDNTASHIFAEHFIEHMPRERARMLIRECYRVLEPGGMLRFTTPDLDLLVEDYLANKLDRWSGSGWIPKTKAQLINEGMRFWGHEFLYNADDAEELLEEAGFRDIKPCEHRYSKHYDFNGIEFRPFTGELVYEARK